MKKTIRIVALAVVLCAAAAGCQKETIREIGNSTAATEHIRTATYTVDGVTHRVTLLGDEAWMAFIHSLTDLARNGHSVIVVNEAAYANSVSSTKEKVVYTTDDQNDADKWAAKMMDKGYSVSIDYDQTTGIYTCTAVK